MDEIAKCPTCQVMPNDVEHDCLIALNSLWDELNVNEFLSISKPTEEEQLVMRQKLNPVADRFIMLARARKIRYDQAKIDFESAQEASIRINETAQEISRKLIEMLHTVQYQE